MPFNFKILAVCKGCSKRRLYLSRPWIKPHYLPKIRPNDVLCRKCLSLASKI